MNIRCRIGDVHILTFTVASWSLVNIVLWSTGSFSLHQLLLYWATTGALFTGEVAAVTITLIFITIGFSVYAFIWKHKKRWMTGVILSTTTPFAGLSLFEIVYLNLPFFVRPQIFNMPLADQLELTSWLILGFSSIRYWKLSASFYISAVAFCTGFLSWSIIGYPHIYETTNPLVQSAVLLNIITKVAAFLIFLSLIYAGQSLRH